MNRQFKFALAAIVVASLVVALGAVAWRWRELGDLAAVFAGPKPFRPFVILAMPVVLAGLLAFTDHSVATAERPMSRERLWFVSFTLLTHFALLLGLQLWMVVTYLGPVRPDREFVIRLLAAFMGLGMAVRGNFFAKLSPPAEDGAGDWARTARRTSMTLVLTGLALAACAVTLPIKDLLLALGAVFVVVLILTGAQRRAAARL